VWSKFWNGIEKCGGRGVKIVSGLASGWQASGEDGKVGRSAFITDKQ
jgi:hypothetical protein